MRVLFVCTALGSHGGIQRFNRNLARALGDLDAELDIVAVNDPPMPRGSSGENAVRIHGANGSKLRWAATVFRLLVTRRYNRCVCGHLHLAAPFSAILGLLGYRRDRRVLILHGIEVWDRVAGLRRSGARRFGKVLAVSQYTAKSFLEQVNGFPADAVAIFPNTISPDLPVVTRVTAMTGEISGGLRVLSVARLARSEREKGILDVLAAVAALHETVVLRYVIVGDGDDRVFLQERAYSLGLAKRVAFVGSLADDALWSAYVDTDVFVLPSRKEGFGIVYLEAMSFGLPVIGAREKGAVDVIRQNVNGLLVDYGDIPAISRAMTELSSNRELRLRLGAAGKALVDRGGEFSFEAFRARCKRSILTA